MPRLSACLIVHYVSYGIEQANNFQLCVTNENQWEVCNILSLQVMFQSSFLKSCVELKMLSGEAVLNIVIWFQTLVLKKLFNPQHSWNLHTSHGIERKTQLLE